MKRRTFIQTAGAAAFYSRSNGFRWNALEDALRQALDAERPEGITT